MGMAGSATLEHSHEVRMCFSSQQGVDQEAREVFLVSKAVRFLAISSVKGTVTSHTAQLHGLAGTVSLRQSFYAL